VADEDAEDVGIVAKVGGDQITALFGGLEAAVIDAVDVVAVQAQGLGDAVLVGVIALAAAVQIVGKAFETGVGRHRGL